ncbi:hypothetical protein ACFLXZ_00385 [Chloroflexota bacterium]
MKLLKIRYFLVLLGLLVILSACDQRATSEEEITENTFNNYSPCLLTNAMVGTVVRAAGEVAFVDDTEHEGQYIDLEADDCRVGIWVERDRLFDWNAAEEGYFIIGAALLVEGQLTLVPMPARPDDKQLVIELSLPPRLLGMAPPIDDVVGDYVMPSLDKPAYEFNKEALWRDIRIPGIITFVDDSRSAGLYGELENENRIVRLWIERKRWNSWSMEECDNFEVGKSVIIDGILTLVLNEPTVDLSSPPPSGVNILELFAGYPLSMGFKSTRCHFFLQSSSLFPFCILTILTFSRYIC